MEYCLVLFDDAHIAVEHFPDSVTSKYALIYSLIGASPAKTHFVDFEGTNCELWADPLARIPSSRMNPVASALLSAHLSAPIALYGSALVVPEGFDGFWYGFSHDYACSMAAFMTRSLHEAYCRMNASLN